MVRLTEREAEVVRLRDDKGLSWRTTAKVLGTSKSSVYSSYRTAAVKKSRPQKSYGQAIEVKNPKKGTMIIPDIAINTEAA